jgi:GNAT superfamily N-acetyltransferase
MGQSQNETMPVFSDRSLSQKIERTNARSNADFVESHARLFPTSGVEWMEIAGVYAMFDGVGFPTTQTFGLGLFDKITDSEMDKIEAFFKERGADVFHEVSPLADADILSMLTKRGYQPIEFSNVMYQTPGSSEALNSPPNPNISTRPIHPDEVEIFAKVSTSGWVDEMPEFSEQMREFSLIGASADGAIPFFAELDNEPIATGTLYIYDDVASLAGASTIPEQRKKGAQAALLNARLRYALEKGCTIATMDAHPGSQSQRNAEKNGFRVAYTRTKWKLGD